MRFKQRNVYTHFGVSLSVPTYTYTCTACNEMIEKRQSFTDPPLTTCEQCGGTLRKVIHPVGIVFKGSGWYITDSRSSKSSSTSGSSGSSDSGSKESASKDSGSKDSGSKDSGSKESGSKDSGSKDSAPKPSSPSSQSSTTSTSSSGGGSEKS